MMEIIEVAAFGSIHSVYTIAIIVIPIMIVMQLMKDYKILDKITRPFRFLSKMFNISNEAVLPLLVGLIFGLSYGAGVIIQASREGNLDKRDLFLVTIFLAACHAVFEDTLIFVAVGANLFILLGARIVAAVIITYIISRKMPVESRDTLSNLEGQRIKESSTT